MFKSRYLSRCLLFFIYKNKSLRAERIKMKKDQYAPVKLIDTANMSESEFTAARQEIGKFTGGVSLGGSDISTIFGLNPWKSPQELFDQKCGIKPELAVERNSSQKEAGHVLEEAVAVFTKEWFKTFEPQLSVAVLNDSYMYQCGKKGADGNLLYPFAVADLDRIIIINGHKGVLECKTTSMRNKKAIACWKAGIIPAYYETQICHYMAVMNLQFAVIACMWGFTINDMAVIICRRDCEKERIMMELEKDFVSHVLSKTTPDFAKCDPTLIADYYTRLYGLEDESAPAIDVTKYGGKVKKTLDLDQRISECEATLKNLNDEKQNIYNEWYPVFGKAESGFCTLPNGQKAYINLKRSYKRQKVDETKLEKDKPDIYKAYLEPTFNATQFKSDYPDLYKEYLGTKEPNPNVPNTFEVKMDRETIIGGKTVYVFGSK